MKSITKDERLKQLQDEYMGYFNDAESEVAEEKETLEREIEKLGLELNFADIEVAKCQRALDELTLSIEKEKLKLQGYLDEAKREQLQASSAYREKDIELTELQLGVAIRKRDIGMEFDVKRKEIEGKYSA